MTAFSSHCGPFCQVCSKEPGFGWANKENANESNNTVAEKRFILGIDY